jgi:hypothetical protein
MTPPAFPSRSMPRPVSVNWRERALEMANHRLAEAEVARVGICNRRKNWTKQRERHMCSNCNNLASVKIRQNMLHLKDSKGVTDITRWWGPTAPRLTNVDPIFSADNRLHRLAAEPPSPPMQAPTQFEGGRQ